MLRLKNIVRTYKVAGLNVEALKGISLSFRENEFVSILGPSGCGKTTTLNIIGGLDQYTSGDLFIGGKSTKEFNDRAWDVYRNHRVGFIFQAYNLIPHQTILGNVELALTIAGISKDERTRRAMEAIDRVGLKGQYLKKPNQLSGGQCQRVAIARALVNEPEILLADEPTGALDTQTSIQIMELIKEISKEKLVIMVTHNPELAEKYSSRIVRLLDGEVLSDSNPFSEEDEILENQNRKALTSEVISKEKAKMSFMTSCKLSFKNLLSKRKRTIMTIVAGSIGIVGVSAVLSVSRGVKDYIADMQDDMLSGNPLQITKTAIDYNALMGNTSLSTMYHAVKKEGFVNVEGLVGYLAANKDVLMSLVYQNKFTEEYVDYVKSMPSDYYSAIGLDYGLDLSTNIYTDFKVDDTHTKYNKNMSIQAITSTYTSLIGKLEDYSQYASTITSLVSSFGQGISNNDYISKQYDVVSGTLPTSSHDVLVVLSDEEELTDLLLAQLGYYSQEEFFNLVYKALPENGKYDPDKLKESFTYEELLGKDFTWYNNDVVFNKKNSDVNPFDYNYSSEGFNANSENSVKLNVCGIVKPKKGISYGALSTGFLYTEDFAREVIRKNAETELVKYLAVKKSIDSGYSVDFDENNMPIMESFVLKGIYYNLPYYYDDDSTGDNNETVFVGSSGSTSSMMGIFSQMMGGNSDIDPAYAKYLETKTLTSREVGGESLPEAINIYPVNFDQKDKVTDYLDKWNESGDVTFNTFDDDYKNVTGSVTLSSTDELRTSEIKYTDTVGLIINMINMMINIITVALVAFTALSLVVSAVMVGIITYVSVVERTKEIGVIRSLGGRKKDVSHLFNAETFMIGLSSGVFGIIVTGILALLLNVIVKAAAGINSIAHLTLPTAIVMIVISILLTLISGFFPARSAAKRDPVEALRSE